MSKPVNIKIAHINKNDYADRSLDKNKVYEVFQANINEQLKTFYRLQQEWVNRAYKNWNDFDTYLILMYLMNKVYINYSDPISLYVISSFLQSGKGGY